MNLAGMRCPKGDATGHPHQLADAAHAHCQRADPVRGQARAKPCGWVVCRVDRAVVELRSGRWMDGLPG